MTNTLTAGYELRTGMVTLSTKLVLAAKGHCMPLVHTLFSLSGKGNGILMPAIVPNSSLVTDLNSTLVVKFKFIVMLELR